MELLTWFYVLIFFFGIFFLWMFILLYARHKKGLFDYPVPVRFPSISIMTPAYNEGASIIGTLQSLVDMKYPEGKKEIIVINDGSIDNTLELIKKFMKKHKEIRLLDKPNSGKADSLNQAIKIAKGELIAVADADSHPIKEALERMVGYFEEDEKVAAVTSKVWVKVNEKRNFLEKFQDIDYVVIAWSRKMLDFIDCVYVTNGPLSLYRKDIVKKVGGFDVKNITEDIELTWNLLSMGYKTKMSYSATVYTVVPDNFRQWINQRVRWNLGGLQTLNKYKKFFMKGENLFGYFIMTYVGLSFILALLGFTLFLRFIYLKISPYIFSLPFFIQGYNPFMFFEFYIPFTLLLLLGLMFLFLSIVYHKVALKDSDLKRRSIMVILVYTFIYRPLYLVPLVLSLYKLIKGDIGWYTK